MTPRRKRILVTLGAAILLIAAVAAGAGAILGGVLRRVVERYASGALGRELRVAGPLEVSLSLRPRITAREVTLASPPWGSEADMIRVGRAAVTVELSSLLSGPVRVRDAEIEDARVLLEVDGAGNGNWVLAARGAGAAARSSTPPLVIDRVSIRRLELDYRPPPGTEPLHLAVAELEARVDPASRTIAVRGGGRLAELPWELTGSLGTYEGHFLGEVEHAFTARLGASRLEARGRFRGSASASELELTAEGPDLAEPVRALRLGTVPGGPFRVRGRLAPAAEGMAGEVEAALGGMVARVRTSMATAAAPMRLTVDIEGRDASAVAAWLGVKGMVAWPFAISGQVQLGDGRLGIQRATVRFGPTSLAIDGVLGAPPRFEGTDLTIRASGQDLSRLAGRAGPRLPKGAFALAGRLRRGPAGLSIRGAELRTRGALIRADGVLGEPPSLAKLDLTVDASGPDLAAFSSLAGRPLPRVPFTLRGRVTRDGAALRLEGVEAALGGSRVRVDGRVALARRLEGTELGARASGPDLAHAAAAAGLRGLPAQPFEVSGRIRVVAGGYELEQVEATVGRIAAAVDGRMGAAPGLRGTAVRCRVRGPSLADLAAWGVPRALPAERFSLAGRLRIDGDRLVHADAVALEVGADRAVVDGALAVLPDLSGLDATVEAAGPSVARLARLAPLLGLTVPAHLPQGGYRISGRVRRAAAGLELGDVRVSAAGTELRIQGVIGPGPELAGTALAVSASGPDLAATLGPFLPGARLPQAPFGLSAELSGTRDRVEAARLEARIGGSSAEGSLALHLDGRPEVEGELRAALVDVDELVGGGAGADRAAPPASAAAGDGKRLIPDRPLSLGAPGLDVRLEMRAVEVRVAGISFREVALSGELRDGALRIDRLQGASAGLGRIEGRLTVTPADSGYRVLAEGRLEDLVLAAPRGEAPPAQAPSLRAEFKLEGEGRSSRALASTLDGVVKVVVGPGTISGRYQAMTSGLVPGLLDALNPFRKSSRDTQVECGIAVAVVQRGKAAVAPIAARTDQVTVIGKGSIDLDTEDVQLEWTLKARSGAGLSVGSIANPYVKLGGTLAAPRLEVKPVQAVASTGAAIATMGLSVLAQGVYDRVTAEKDVCVNALVSDMKADAAGP